MNTLEQIEQIEQKEQLEIQAALSPAERYYANHLRHVSRYQKQNPEKMRANCNKYNEILRKNPEKYAASLAKKRNYYHEIVKLNKNKKSNKIINSETLAI